MTASASATSRPLVPVPTGTIPGALATAARQYPDAIALIDGDRRMSWAELQASADRLAHGLLSLGLTRGDRIGVVALNQIESVQLFFAAARIGVALVGMSVRYRDNELDYMVNDSQVKIIFTLGQHADFDFFAMWARLAAKLPTLQQVIGIDRAAPGGTSLAALQSDSPLADPATFAKACAAVAEGDLAMVIYTSGTTGRPKGAGLTHHSMLASARAQAAHLRLGPSDLLQLATPLNHVGGITCGILSMLLGGGTCDLIAEFKPVPMLQRMEQHPPTILAGVPTMMTLLLMHADKHQVDWPRIRAMFCGGSNVDATLLTRLEQQLPNATLMNLYGLSEVSGANVMTPWGSSREDLMQSIGKTIGDAQVRCIGSDGQPLPAGEIGELCYRGAGTIPGYIGAAATASGAFDQDGWLHSGDLGKVDERGMITLMGRAKDMYIQGGFNVYPAEIEAFIAQHPKVMMVAGIGVPDPVLGEVGRYYIVANPGSGLTEADIRQHCRDHLADYKLPRQIVLRDTLPLTPAGKIHKAALRQEQPAA